jgi:hypothetical protein
VQLAVDGLHEGRDGTIAASRHRHGLALDP